MAASLMAWGCGTGTDATAAGPQTPPAVLLAAARAGQQDEHPAGDESLERVGELVYQAPAPPPPAPRPTPRPRPPAPTTAVETQGQPPAPTPPSTTPPQAPPPRTEIDRRVTEAGGRPGDIEIAMAWNNYNDLDLLVVGPCGEQIYWQRPHACGGELDVDMNVDPQTNRAVEHVRWATPIPGRYAVAVRLHSAKDPAGSRTPFRVQIRVGSDVVVRSGVTSSVGRDIPVYTFEVP